MNTTINAGPMGDGCWATFEHRERQAVSERNRRAGRYCGTDPATVGWRRPDSAQLRAVPENGVREQGGRPEVIL